MLHLRRKTFPLLLAIGLMASLSAASVFAYNNSGGSSHPSISALAYAYMDIYKNYMVKVLPPDHLPIWRGLEDAPIYSVPLLFQWDDAK